MRKVNWGIAAKIVLGYSVIILFLAFSILMVNNQMTSLQREIDRNTKQSMESNNLTNRIELLLLGMETGQRGFIITGDDRYLEPYRTGIAEWETDYDLLLHNVSDNAEQRETLKSLKKLIQQWIGEAAEPSITLKREHKEQELLVFFTKDLGKPTMDQIRALFDEFRANQAALTELESDKLREQNQWLKIIMIVTLLVISIAAIMIAFAISGGIVRTLNEVIRAIREVASSEQNLTGRIKVGTNDEISDLALATNELLDNLRQLQWVSEQHAGIVIRHEGIFDIHELAESFAARLAETVGAVYAVLYIRTFDGSDTVLERVGSYALEQDREGRRSFRLGEGLVGQCAKDNKPFMLEELSEHYYHISSGLGEAAPNSLLIAPSAFEGKVIAVMELASFGTFTSAEKQLVFRALETLGARLNDVLSRMENGKLLQESQALTAELQAQSEELQAHQEEMQVTNEHLAEQNRLAEQRSAELEKIQSELEEHAEQLKQSSRYKSEFLANISHELRTPLNGMLILSQMLAENENSNLDIDEQKYAVVIHEAGEDLLGLINDILDLSKVEAGKLDIVMEKISVAELPDLMEHQFSKTAEQKGIKFRVEMSDDCPAFITTDEQRLHQVVRNLLSNAFTFTEQGVVKLTVRKAADDEMTQRLPLHVGKQAIVIAVSDTGIGIPRDKQGLIFEAFQQADGTTSRKYGGTGLGLSISRELTSLLGGCIVVDSAVGEGSTFTVYIPSMVNVGLAIEQGLEPLLPGAAPAEEQNIERGYPDANSPFNRIKGKKVLIVDDDDRNLFALEQTLIREGLQVVTARNGRQGVDMLEQEWNVELVLMDIMMPVLDGYGAIREIRANPAHHKLPIIAITAKAMKQDHEQCLEAGASDYISKPLNTKQLLSLIYVWLTKQDQD